MNLIPLQQFICDECGKVIQSPDDGWLEWLVHSPGNMALYGFRIVHRATASPRRQHGGRCQYPTGQAIGDLQLEYFLGPDGLASLLSLFERPLDDLGELVEIIRRLHIPHYEEARQYWQTAKADGFFIDANEVSPYLQDSLQTIIREYGQEE